MSLCPCGSQLDYQQCCGPAHQDHHQVTTAEQLMRSRYSAHVLGLVDYVVKTYHPSCHAEKQRAGIAESINSRWCKLEVLNRAGGSDADEAFVEFKAYFLDGERLYCLHENSRFVRENQLWYYIDGTFPADAAPEFVKIGRNDLCPCGSGKKFKKCCGK